MTTPPPPNHALDQVLADQQRLLDAFEAARDAGISTPRGVQRLREVEDDLRRHLSVVDTTLYPLLRRLAARDPRVHRALERAGQDETAARVDAFFTHYADPDAPDFFTQWGAVYVAVQRRFRLERTQLFPALRDSELAQDLTLPMGGRPRSGTGPLGYTSLLPKRQSP